MGSLPHLIQLPEVAPSTITRLLTQQVFWMNFLMGNYLQCLKPIEDALMLVPFVMRGMTFTEKLVGLTDNELKMI